MTDNATLLQRLVDLTELALAARLVSSESIADLRALLAEAAARPCEGERFIGAEVLLLGQVLHLIGEARLAGDDRRATAFRQVGGVLLPVVRELWSRAVMTRRNTVAIPDRTDYHPQRGGAA